MGRDPSIPQQPSPWSRFVAFKTLLVSFSLVGLLASNVATLVSASAHDWMITPLFSSNSVSVAARVWLSVLRRMTFGGCPQTRDNS